VPSHSASPCPRSSDPLVDASWAGRADLVLDLLNRGGDPNRRDERECSPLGAATRRGHVEVMRALIDAGADATEVTDARTGETLLSIAAILSRVEPMRLLLAAGADPNREPNESYTVLMEAAGASYYSYPGANLSKRTEMVRLLIAAGADVNAVAFQGATPLSATRGEDELVRLLLEAGAFIPPHRPGDTPLLVQAMGYGRLRPSQEAGILRLIAAGADVNAAYGNRDTPLKRACTLGSARVVAALLEMGARRVGAGRDTQGDPPPELHCAARAGEPRIVRMLLHDGAELEEVDYAGRTPLYLAAMNGRSEALRVLLAAGANPNAGRERGRSALRAAAYHGHAECVSLLLGAGADIDARTEGEVTALHLASLMRRLKVVPLLLCAGASADSRDADGRTPLMWALRTKAERERASKKAAGTVGLLLAAGADPHATDRRGQTALFDAARAGLTNEIRRLLALGLDVNAAAFDGGTPLMAAAGARDVDTRSAEVLLAEGAEINAVDRAGSSALHWALRPQEPPSPPPRYWCGLRRWAEPMLDLLLKAGTDVNHADNRGVTPLMLAAQNQSRSLIASLLKAGADPEARDGQGRTAKDYVEATGRPWP